MTQMYTPPTNATPCTGYSARHGVVARRVARGFSLVELMVAMTIGLMIIVALTAMYVASSAGKKTDARYAEFQTNARYAMDVIKRDIQVAGFTGFTYQMTPQLASTNISSCGDGFVTRLEQPIYGVNNANTATCVSAAEYSQGDVLVLRRAGPECAGAPPCPDTIKNNLIYMRSSFNNGLLYVGNTAPGSFAPFSEDFQLHTDVYYISPYTTSATESPQVPALYRKSLSPGPTMAAQLIASNIEDMQLQYGVRIVDPVTKAETTQFYDATTLPAAGWPNVTSLRIWLLARSTDADPGFTATQTYEYADKLAFNKSDGYQRQLVQQVIQVRK